MPVGEPFEGQGMRLQMYTLNTVTYTEASMCKASEALRSKLKCRTLSRSSIGHAPLAQAFLSVWLGLPQQCPPTPARPWNMILYIGEILSGNQLAYKSARKMWCCYWSVLEFGSAALSHEELTNNERNIVYDSVLQHMFASSL